MLNNINKDALPERALNFDARIVEFTYAVAKVPACLQIVHLRDQGRQSMIWYLQIAKHAPIYNVVEQFYKTIEMSISIHELSGTCMYGHIVNQWWKFPQYIMHFLLSRLVVHISVPRRLTATKWVTCT